MTIHCLFALCVYVCWLVIGRSNYINQVLFGCYLCINKCVCVCVCLYILAIVTNE